MLDDNLIKLLKQYFILENEMNVIKERLKIYNIPSRTLGQLRKEIMHHTATPPKEKHNNTNAQKHTADVAMPASNKTAKPPIPEVFYDDQKMPNNTKPAPNVIKAPWLE